jgi:hypothetical protein
MKALLKIARPLYASVLLLLGLLLGGCGPSFYLASYERDISSSTRARPLAMTPSAQPHTQSEAAPIRRRLAIAGLSS